MKRSSIILAPPLVFALTAILAWFAGSPADRSDENCNARRSPRNRAVAGVGSDSLPAALLRMESRILPHNPAPPTGEIHDARGMAVRSGTMYGMEGIEYAFDWAEEAPEEMFAWLVRQNQKRWSEASILFKTWAESNMEVALTASLKIPNLKLRAQALISTLEVLCQSDPARAGELLLQNLGLFPADGNGPLFAGYNAFAPTWDLLLSLPPCKERTHLQAKLLSGARGESVWNQASEFQRREWVDAGCSPYYPGSFEGLEGLQRERAEITGDPKVARRFVANFGDIWAERDLAAAVDWTQAHLKGNIQVESCENLFQTGIRENFDTTLRIWQNLPDGYRKRSVADAMQRAAPESRKSELEAAIQSMLLDRRPPEDP